MPESHAKKTCTLCKKQVRSDRYHSHVSNQHKHHCMTTMNELTVKKFFELKRPYIVSTVKGTTMTYDTITCMHCKKGTYAGAIIDPNIFLTTHHIGCETQNSFTEYKMYYDKVNNVEVKDSDKQEAEIIVYLQQMVKDSNGSLNTITEAFDSIKNKAEDYISEQEWHVANVTKKAKETVEQLMREKDLQIEALQEKMLETQNFFEDKIKGLEKLAFGRVPVCNEIIMEKKRIVEEEEEEEEEEDEEKEEEEDEEKEQIQLKYIEGIRKRLDYDCDVEDVKLENYAEEDQFIEEYAIDNPYSQVCRIWENYRLWLNGELTRDEFLSLFD